MNLETLGVEYAVGGSVEVAVRRSGAGFLYVRPDVARSVEPGIAGWAAHARPFEFATGAIEYAGAPERFQSGTPNVPSLYSCRAGYTEEEVVGAMGILQEIAAGDSRLAVRESPRS